MKKNTHPKYYPNAKVTCSCGEKFETGSTLSELNVEICSACHPFFTGEMRFVDTQGRVEKFEAMRKKAASLQKELGKKTKENEEEQTPKETKSLKEMMQEVAKTQNSTPQKKSSKKKTKIAN